MKAPGFTAEASLYKTSRHYALAGSHNGSAGSRGVLPQLANDVWTTDKVCAACGCTVSGFVCDCGLRPDPAKVACIQNGGPARPMQVFGGAGIGRNVFRGNVFQGKLASRV